jgi:hypothetical protein
MYQMQRTDYLYMAQINKKLDNLTSITEYKQIEELMKKLEEINTLCIGYNIYRRIHSED